MIRRTERRSIDVPLRILAADDHPLVLEGTRVALTKITALVTLATSSDELRSCLARTTFDLILLDLSFKGSDVSGFDLLREVMANSSKAPVVVLSMHDDRHVQESSRQAGARGFVSKMAQSEELIEAVNTVAAGGTWFRIPSLAEHPITSRQIQIVKLLAEGSSEKEIADLLGVAVRTVEFHVAAAKRTMEARSTNELIRKCLDRGLFLTVRHT